MPSPVAEIFDTYDYVPESRTFLLTGASPDNAIGLDVITNGRYRVIGNSVRDTTNGRIVTNLSPSRGSFLHVESEGTILLNNRVPAARLASYQGTDAMPRLEITGGLERLGMDITQDVNLITSLAPANALIYVDDSKPANRRQFTTLSAGLFGAQGAPASNEFGRLARSEDLIRRGVAGWLIRNATAALEAAKLSGVTLSDGTTSTNVSDIVASMWAEVQVSPIVTWVLGEAALEP